MTYSNQETYSEIVFYHPPESELDYSLFFESQNETIGKSSYAYGSFVSENFGFRGPFHFEPTNETIDRLGYSSFLLEITSLTKSALKTIQKAPNPQVAKEAENLLSIIHKMMVFLRKRGVNLPSLHAFNIDDGSVSIECSFNNLKVGFNIEPEQKDSGWYMVSNEELGEITASGYISSIDTNRLIGWLFLFILVEPYEITFEPYEITG